jgi:hypothetical protein
MTTKFKILFLEEVVGINDIDFEDVPTNLIDYYIELKLKGFI